jgi:hypothetical protein
MAEFLSRGQQIHNRLDTNPTDANFFNGSVPMENTAHDPYVSGYAFIKWLKVPTWIPNPEQFKAYSEKNFKAFSGLSNISMGTAGVKAGFTETEVAYATSISKQGEFSLKYQQHSGGPLKTIYDAWVSGIRDPKTGIATYPLTSGLPYHSSNHTGVLLYVVTRPDANNFGGKNIEFAALYTKVMPTIIHLDHYNFESGSHDVTESDQEFKAYMHIGAKVEDFAANYMQSTGTYTFYNENEFNNIDKFTTT